MQFFFAQFIIKEKKVSDSINIVLKKVHGQSVTASQLRANPYWLVNFICEDQAYLFQRQNQERHHTGKNSCVK